MPKSKGKSKNKKIEKLEEDENEKINDNKFLKQQKQNYIKM
jgi:hypothetical protein